MIRALFTAATGMNAQQNNIDVIANNLANVNTNGFKKSRADFQDLLYETLIEPGASTTVNTTNPTGLQIGLGVKTAAVTKIFEQGDLTSTNNQLDMAIEGDGLFQITLPDGTIAYTRSGSFKLNENGDMVTTDGFPLEPAIQIPSGSLSVIIAQDGTVSAKTSGSATPTQVGNIQIARFPNSSGLKAIGKNLLQETQSSGTPTVGTPGAEGYGRLSQGFLESSNVSVVEQVVNMIVAQRGYEASSKVISTADEMSSQALSLKR